MPRRPDAYGRAGVFLTGVCQEKRIDTALRCPWVTSRDGDSLRWGRLVCSQINDSQQRRDPALHLSGCHLMRLSRHLALLACAAVTPIAVVAPIAAVLLAMQERGRVDTA